MYYYGVIACSVVCVLSYSRPFCVPHHTLFGYLCAHLLCPPFSLSLSRPAPSCVQGCRPRRGLDVVRALLRLRAKLRGDLEQNGRLFRVEGAVIAAVGRERPCLSPVYHLSIICPSSVLSSVLSSVHHLSIICLTIYPSSVLSSVYHLSIICLVICSSSVLSSVYHLSIICLSSVYPIIFVWYLLYRVPDRLETLNKGQARHERAAQVFFFMFFFLNMGSTLLLLYVHNVEMFSFSQA